MKKKIIFWCDVSQVQYGLAKKLQDVSNYDLFAIFDVPYKQEKFFRTENIVKFQKKWFLHDGILEKEKPDIEYLKGIEEKYGINLWLLAYNERIFFNYYNYKNFSDEEVLLILEQECKLFEKILDEIKPDFLAIITNTHQSQLFYELCKAKGIQILLLYSVRLKDKVQIGIDPNQLEIRDKIENDFKFRTFKELQEFQKEDVLFNESKKFNSAFSNSKLMLVKAAIEYLFSPNNIEKTHFTYYGRTKSKVLLNSILDKNKIKKRTNYINKNFLKEINDNDDFIFFPLQQDPERTILIDAPYFSNQIQVVKNVAQSLPVGKKLFVKEHISQVTRAWRDIKIYKELEKIPNVVLVHPSVKPSEIFSRCKMTITITGTAAFECLFYNKPSIVFSHTIFSELSSVEVVTDLNKLPEIIRSSLKKNVELKELYEFINKIEKNSFSYGWNGFIKDAIQHFYYKGNLSDVEIKNEDMIQFLDEKDDTLLTLANEFIKEIEWRQRID